jgi:hypothetical protein
VRRRPALSVERAGRRDVGTPSRALSLKGGGFLVAGCSATCLDGTLCIQPAWWAHRRVIDLHDRVGRVGEYLPPVIDRGLGVLSEELGLGL